MVRTRSVRPVNAVAFTELDGAPIAVSGGGDGTVRVWDLVRGTQRGDPFTGNTRSVRAVAVGALPDGTPIAVSGGRDRTVRVWDLDSRAEVGLVTNRSGSVNAVAVSTVAGQQPRLLTAGSGGLLQAWDLSAQATALTTCSGWRTPRRRTGWPDSACEIRRVVHRSRAAPVRVLMTVGGFGRRLLRSTSTWTALVVLAAVVAGGWWLAGAHGTPGRLKTVLTTTTTLTGLLGVALVLTRNLFWSAPRSVRST